MQDGQQRPKLGVKGDTMTTPHILTIAPRLIRMKDAPRYLGMDRNRFNKLVRPYVHPLRFGKQSIAFDRLELDAWVDDTISRCGCSPKHRRTNLCQREPQASKKEARMASGTLTNESKDMDAFTRARERASLKKQSDT